MAKVRAAAKRRTTIQVPVSELQALIVQVEKVGQWMPAAEVMKHVQGDVYHYRLVNMSDGSMDFTPDYHVTFDISDPANVRWEPHGEANFVSRGVFRSLPGPVPEESVLEIDVSTHAEVDIDPLMLPLVEPLARDACEQVTEEYLKRIKADLESVSNRQDVGNVEQAR
ncbi:MAG TPA: hypothetical protein VFN67_03925 [Polyangiales bacterium]|nr:hypothetical protein [Polyangiales bacterium]